MKVLNYGSLNVDYVYSVDHIIVGGETQHSSKMEIFSGGKGLNQSIALAKAGVPVYHAGIVGNDGDILLDACKEAGVNTKYIRRLPVKGGALQLPSRHFKNSRSASRHILAFLSSSTAITSFKSPFLHSIARIPCPAADINFSSSGYI